MSSKNIAKAVRYVLFVIIAITLGIWIQKIQINRLDKAALLTFLNVGQGDCAVFEHFGKTVLIDAGPKTRESDAAEKTITNFLHEHQINKIDLVLLSHPDLDHIGGMTSLLKRFNIGKILMPDRFKSDKDMHDLLAKSGLTISDIYWLKGKANTQIGEFKIELFSPHTFSNEKDNEASMFVRIIGGKCSALFTGDASITKENQMIPYNSSWNSQLFKAGNHGSKNSTGTLWLEEVSPKYVIFSCGYNNPYHHPHPTTLRRVSTARSKYLRTDQNGHIQFKATSQGFSLIPNQLPFSRSHF